MATGCIVKPTISALAIAIAISGPAAAAPTCFTNKEMRASQVRQLQTELMVAALSCKDPSLDFAGRYNAFVHKFGKNLAENATTLRGYFSRRYGKRHAHHFDAYITSLANNAAHHSMGVNGYCGQMAPLFEQVLRINARELESFAAKVGDPDDGCR